jgi:hypothetical protein
MEGTGMYAFFLQLEWLEMQDIMKVEEKDNEMVWYRDSRTYSMVSA